MVKGNYACLYPRWLTQGLDHSGAKTMFVKSFCKPETNIMKYNNGTLCLSAVQCKLPMPIKSHIWVFLSPLTPISHPVDSQRSNHVWRRRLDSETEQGCVRFHNASFVQSLGLHTCQSTARPEGSQGPDTRRVPAVRTLTCARPPGEPAYSLQGDGRGRGRRGGRWHSQKASEEGGSECGIRTRHCQGCGLALRPTSSLTLRGTWPQGHPRPGPARAAACTRQCGEDGASRAAASIRAFPAAQPEHDGAAGAPERTPSRRPETAPARSAPSLRLAPGKGTQSPETPARRASGRDSGACPGGSFPPAPTWEPQRPWVNQPRPPPRK